MAKSILLVVMGLLMGAVLTAFLARQASVSWALNAKLMDQQTLLAEMRRSYNLGDYADAASMAKAANILGQNPSEEWDTSFLFRDEPIMHLRGTPQALQHDSGYAYSHVAAYLYLKSGNAPERAKYMAMAQTKAKGKSEADLDASAQDFLRQ